MIAHTHLFVFAVGCLLSLLSGAAALALRRTGRAGQAGTLEDILRRLAAVDRYNLALVASELDAQGDVPEQTTLEAWQIYELVGGMDGLAALAANCDVLIDLACHVQVWYPEALVVAEQLRLNAREIQWHIERLQGAERRGHLQSAFPDYAQRAAAIYLNMTRHVLELYQLSQMPELSRLKAVL